MKKKKKKKSLPEEVIVEILSKLPVKSLIRFRCVCKSWFDLIKSPYFINRHSTTTTTSKTKNDECILSFRHKKDDSGAITILISLISLKSRSVLSPSLEIPHFEYVVKYCGSCDGLICLANRQNVVLCNPSMREFKLLVPCPEQVGFDRTAIGLGFDSTTKDYKVVRIHLKNPDIAKVNVYNLSTNSWREINHNIPRLAFTLFFGTLYRGVYHWIAVSVDKGFILSFDMITEVFTRIELPDIHHGIERQKRLTVFNGSLCLLVGTGWRALRQGFQEFVDIWVMRQYGVAESWTKQFAFGPRSASWNPFLLWKNKVIVLETKTIRGSTMRQVLSCDLDTHEMNVLYIHGINDNLDIRLINKEKGIDDIREIMDYRESLVSIK